MPKRVVACYPKKGGHITRLRPLIDRQAVTSARNLYTLMVPR
jgi:hypothetical protein